MKPTHAQYLPFARKRVAETIARLDGETVAQPKRDDYCHTCGGIGTHAAHCREQSK